MSKSGKYSFLIEYPDAYPKLTYQLMEKASIYVNEIVSTQNPERNSQYTYIHLKHKIHQQDLCNTLKFEIFTVAQQFEENCFNIFSSSVKSASLIENHPGFILLVDHEETKNANFSRWVDEDFPCKWASGYTRLKSKLKPKSQMQNAGIYVLRLTSKPTPFFYVGKAINIEHRIAQHASGSGAVCITGEPFERVEPVTKMSADDMESWERNEVLARMFEFGIDNVRGWMYTLRTMPLEQKLSAFDQICEKFDRCRKCGRGTHFVRDCHALSADLWTCGMELRTAYRGAPGSTEVALANADAERQAAQAALADAERRIAEAASVLMRVSTVAPTASGMPA